jgi:hypothetical protein
MSLKSAAPLPLVAALLLLAGCSSAPKEKGLHVVYGEKGLEQLRYNGVVLEDLNANPGDAFHIWHMKATDAQGKVLGDGQYGWGENNSGRTWDPQTHTWTYKFTWGSIAVQFAQSRDTLDMNVTEKNNADSGITFDGATIYPFVLRFPQLPAGFGDASFAHLALTKGSGPDPVADFGDGKVTATVVGKLKPLYYGFEPAKNGPNYFPIISSTAMDSQPPSMPRLDRPVAPGKEDSFTVSLKFSGGSSEQ